MVDRTESSFLNSRKEMEEAVERDFTATEDPSGRVARKTEAEAP